MAWKLAEWNEDYCKAVRNELPAMTAEEINAAIKYLQDNNYPKPTDCPEHECPVYRPACRLGVCRIAVGMCGDF